LSMMEWLLIQPSPCSAGITASGRVFAAPEWRRHLDWQARAQKLQLMRECHAAGSF